ncbi:integrase, partial [Sporosarcina sp. OR05]
MAKKRGGNRLKYQVEQAIKKINMIGVSKRELRGAKTETGIHSISQVKHALSVSQNFAEWAKKQDIKDLFQLKRSHYRAYIAHKQAEGVSNGHLINIETNLRLLEKGMNSISREKGFSERNWTPKTRLIDTSVREKPQNRSYSTEETKEYLNKLSENARVGGVLQSAFGLRLREAANTKGAHIVEKDGRLFWEACSDKLALNTA